ncbi:Pentatricopeptide repeat-containing protein MRL1, chloroplastic [Symbiodinium microadriaticum]|uniref:Pentatricopeptide repeat-containing protein MRL1, chloroplastic n=1 Tax=Symbiodinium microadriaticum TaxID=2951 RepID=A0A1Q9DJT5_SYMMI|nr:Pentatricopeptide repeat-containing protein MRL1, chloroplastic [Symbiodinium microadriaticum]
MRRCCASKKGVAARCDPPDQSPRGQATTNPRRGRRPVLGEAMWWWSPHLHRPPLRSERQKQPTPHLVAEGRKQSMYPELVSGRAAPVRAGCEVGGKARVQSSGRGDPVRYGTRPWDVHVVSSAVWNVILTHGLSELSKRGPSEVEMNRGSSRHPHSSVLWLGEVLVGEQAAVSAALEGRSADEDRAALATAMRRKEATYPELPTAARPARSPPCSGYRLGSALVDAAVGHSSARNRSVANADGILRRMQKEDPAGARAQAAELRKDILSYARVKVRQGWVLELLELESEVVELGDSFGTGVAVQGCLAANVWLRCSAFTAEIARVVLDDEESSQAFADVAAVLAQTHVPNLTVVSLDASAAYDGISRQSILQELRHLDSFRPARVRQHGLMRLPSFVYETHRLSIPWCKLLTFAVSPVLTSPGTEANSPHAGGERRSLAPTALAAMKASKADHRKVKGEERLDAIAAGAGTQLHWPRLGVHYAENDFATHPCKSAPVPSMRNAPEIRICRPQYGQEFMVQFIKILAGNRCTLVGRVTEALFSTMLIAKWSDPQTLEGIHLQGEDVQEHAQRARMALEAEAHVNIPEHGSSELADPAGGVGCAVGLIEEGKEVVVAGRASICDEFHAAVFEALGVDVEVAHKHATAEASSAVVTERVHGMATAAAAFEQGGSSIAWRWSAELSSLGGPLLHVVAQRLANADVQQAFEETSLRYEFGLGIRALTSGRRGGDGGGGGGGAGDGALLLLLLLLLLLPVVQATLPGTSSFVVMDLAFTSLPASVVDRSCGASCPRQASRPGPLVVARNGKAGDVGAILSSVATFGQRLAALGLGLTAVALRRDSRSRGDGRTIVRGRNYETNIKKKKGPAERKQAKVTAKHLRNITMAVRDGGPDPSANSMLNRFIKNALKDNVPRDTVDRRIKAFTEQMIVSCRGATNLLQSVQAFPEMNQNQDMLINAGANQHVPELPEAAGRLPWSWAIAGLGHAQQKDGCHLLQFNKLLSALDKGDQWERAAELLLQRAGGLRLEPDMYSLGAGLSALARHRHWAGAAAVLQWGQKEKMQSSEVIFNSLMSSCERSGRWKTAFDVFRTLYKALLQPSPASFSCWSRWPAAAQAISAIRQEGLQPSQINQGVAMKSFQLAELWQCALCLMQETWKGLIEMDQVTTSSAMTALERGRHWEMALHLSGPGADVVRLGAEAAAAAASGWLQALSWLRRAADLSLQIGVVAFGAILAACEKSGMWSLALRILRSMARASVEENTITCNSVLSACEKAGQWSAAVACLEASRSRTVATDALSRNAVISACEKAWHWRMATVLLPGSDEVGCNAAISSCEKVSGWNLAGAILCGMPWRRLLPTEVSHSSALTSYGKRQLWQGSLSLLKSMRRVLLTPNEFTYSAALTACASPTTWQQAVGLLDDMRSDKVLPGGDLLVAVTSACSSASHFAGALDLLMETEEWLTDFLSDCKRR